MKNPRVQFLKLNTDLRHHPKSLHLAGLLGDSRAHLYLVDLWSWASNNQTDGTVLMGVPLSSSIIEDVCQWHGEPGKLTQALVDAGWLDELCWPDEDLPDGYGIHNWDIRYAENKAMSGRKVK